MRSREYVKGHKVKNITIAIAVLMLMTMAVSIVDTEETEGASVPLPIQSGVYSSSETTWLLTKDGRLYGCGHNQYGQQGSGDTSDVNVFTQRMPGLTIASVYCSNKTTWFITTEGKLYGCGYGNDGQQGSGNTSNVNMFTQRMPGLTVESVHCSNKTTWFITTDGHLYGCGSDDAGQQGNGKNEVKESTFTQKFYDPDAKNNPISRIVSFSCSSDTTWFVTKDGYLYGCGSNGFGQQGDDDDLGRWVETFTRKSYNPYSGVFKTIENAKNVACSSYTTWCVTTDGVLYGCGENASYHQGTGTSSSKDRFAQRYYDSEGNNPIKNVESVYCSMSTTWIVTKDGKLYGCGDGTYGQQGNGNTGPVKRFTPRMPDLTVKSVYCSNRATWFVTTDGKLYGCGYGICGQQGSGGTSDVNVFTQRMPDLTIASVASSNYTTWFVTSDGELYGCGSGYYGQQGNGGTDNVNVFTSKERVSPTPSNSTPEPTPGPIPEPNLVENGDTTISDDGSEVSGSDIDSMIPIAAGIAIAAIVIIGAAAVYLRRH